MSTFDATKHKKGDPLPKRGTKAYDKAIAAIRSVAASKARAARAKHIKDGTIKVLSPEEKKAKRRKWDEAYQARKKNGHAIIDAAAQMIPLDMIPDKMPPMARQPRQNGAGRTHGAPMPQERQARLMLAAALIRAVERLVGDQ